MIQFNVFNIFSKRVGKNHQLTITMFTLGIEFTGNDLYNQTTKQSNLQGKYVDVDRVKSKTLQSELPHKLYATKKGARNGRRCGGLRVFFHQKHRYCG